MRDISDLNTVLNDPNLAPDLRNIAEKVLNHQRISNEDANILFEQGSLSYLGSLANFIREEKHGDNTYFNRNFHIEPTNICLYTCTFCSY